MTHKFFFYWSDFFSYISGSQKKPSYDLLTRKDKYVTYILLYDNNQWTLTAKKKEIAATISLKHPFDIFNLKTYKCMKKNALSGREFSDNSLQKNYYSCI